MSNQGSHKLAEDDYTDFDLESDFTPRTFSTTTTRRTGSMRSSAITGQSSSTRNSEIEHSDGISYSTPYNTPTMSSFHLYTRLVPVFITFATVLLFFGILCFFAFHAIFTSIAPVSERAPSMTHKAYGSLGNTHLLKPISPYEGIREAEAFNPFREENLLKLQKLLQESELEATPLDNENSENNGTINLNKNDHVNADHTSIDVYPNLEDNFNYSTMEEHHVEKYKQLLRESECRIPVLPAQSLKRHKYAFQPCESSVNYGIEDSKECCYQIIKSNADSDPDNEIRVPESWKALVCTPFDPDDKESETTISNFEFTRINCRKLPILQKSNEIKTELWARISLKSPIVRNKIQHWVDHPPAKRKPMNVIILGLDGISSQLFQESFIKTRKILKKLEFFNLKGYHIVGQKTLDNVIPLLMGVRKSELPDICNHHWKSYWDDCPFIWKDFSEKNYVTMYAEDIPDTFNFGNQLGFEKKPTDYYLRPIILEKLHFDGNSHCFGNQTTTEFILKYGEQFMQKFQSFSTPFFAFMWLNLPRSQRGDQNQNVDNVLHKFFETLSLKSIAMNNTIFVLLSDHGVQSGPDRTNMKGFLDHRMPMMFVRFPRGPHALKDYENAQAVLNLNRNIIVSPFDIHHSLKAILADSTSGTETQLSTTADLKRMNVFTTVMLNRTCKDAGVDINWCSCNTILIDETSLAKSREYTIIQNNNLIPSVMAKLNEMVSKQRDSLLITRASTATACPELIFDKLLYLGFNSSSNGNENAEQQDLLILGIQVRPQRAQFEVFLIRTDSKWEIVLPIIRVDSVSGHNYCVKVIKTRLY